MEQSVHPNHWPSSTTPLGNPESVAENMFAKMFLFAAYMTKNEHTCLDQTLSLILNAKAYKACKNKLIRTAEKGLV